jgi:hypothetical protein
VDRIYAAVLWACFLAVACSNAVAQYGDDEENDEPRGNINVGATGALGLNPTAPFANSAWGLTVGGGYNLNRTHGFVGEFMWTHLLATDQALAAASSLALNPTLDGAGNLFALTGNYRYERRGTTFGAYFIGGGGLYVRQVYFSKQVIAPPGVACAHVWSWWGFNCAGGVLPAGQTVQTTTDKAPGANGGFGLTARVGPAPNRLYLEARYHYAATSRINTQLVGISFGIRY